MDSLKLLPSGTGSGDGGEDRFRLSASFAQIDEHSHFPERVIVERKRSAGAREVTNDSFVAGIIPDGARLFEDLGTGSDVIVVDVDLLDDALDEQVEQSAILLHPLQLLVQIRFEWFGRGFGVAAFESADWHVGCGDGVGNRWQATGRSEWAEFYRGIESLHADEFADEVVIADFQIAEMTNVRTESYTIDHRERI